MGKTFTTSTTPKTTYDKGVYPMVTANPWRPQRFLDPQLAEAIKTAKLRTGASWRRIAQHTGFSHSYLVELSNGHRVPSSPTVEILADALPIEEWAVEELRKVAVRGHGRDRPG